MTVCFYADETRVAIYDQAPGGGDPLSPNSLMNRPVLSPLAWLSSIYFHSDLDYYNTANRSQITIAHAAAPAGIIPITQGMSVVAQPVVADHLLVTHGLGYIPKFVAAYNRSMISHGYPVQRDAPGVARFVSAYATTTQIRLRELAWRTDTQGLTAANIAYDVLVFADSVKNPALPNLDFRPGFAVMGQGKFNMEQPPMRLVAPGESPLAMAMSRTTAVSNGALRSYLPNGSAVDYGPFNGSLPAPTFITVEAGR